VIEQGIFCGLEGVPNPSFYNSREEPWVTRREEKEKRKRRKRKTEKT
jgi:hypothetical protein